MTTTQPTINNQQTQILFLLYKFRFLTINQLLKYFNHKYPSRIRTWLTELVELKYISAIMDDANPTKFFIYCLSTKAKYILQKNEDCNKDFLERLYKEKKLKDKFINHCLFILDIYFYFLSQLEVGATLHFLTQQDLIGYDFFPEELPDAYIAVETKDGTDKYFLELFDDYQNKQSPGSIRFSTRKYINYSGDGSWEANTNNSPFPAILFVLPNERRRQFANHYGHAKLVKTWEDISLFLTTQDMIRFSKSGQNIWQKVE
ncbi:MAG: hypothetical protein A3E90_01315 [Candidatus Portnoybacteria bacterium RIFCSPHIGHO2_12_FULL_40_11]|uniref:Replication-relaxation n=3 Tax=Patescibacteria group TaxID=1783273 RepID=A0A1G2FMH7_9BACT|nr:MAG: hypothetical protein A3E90_01315 [Candidatus Portnoybacteria bacterium RIFCSPHIGHO2_12_FULL_40_11]